MEGQPTANGLLSYQLAQLCYKHSWLAAGVSFCRVLRLHSLLACLSPSTINFLCLLKLTADETTKREPRYCAVNGSVPASFIAPSVCLPNGALGFPALHSRTPQFITSRQLHAFLHIHYAVSVMGGELLRYMHFHVKLYSRLTLFTA